MKGREGKGDSINASMYQNYGLNYSSILVKSFFHIGEQKAISFNGSGSFQQSSIGSRGYTIFCQLFQPSSQQKLFHKASIENQQIKGHGVSVEGVAWSLHPSSM